MSWASQLMTLMNFWRLSKYQKSARNWKASAALYAKPGTWDKFIAYESKMRVQRKQEAEARQRQIAATIRYVSWGVIAAISIGGLALLYFFTEFSARFEMIWLP
jgi:hypothetical protein